MKYKNTAMWLQKALEDLDLFEEVDEHVDLQAMFMDIFQALATEPANVDDVSDDKCLMIKEDMYQVATGLSWLITNEESRDYCIEYIREHLKTALDRMTGNYKEKSSGDEERENDEDTDT